MKKNFLMKMKHSMMAIFSVVAMGMITASLAACSSSEDESEKNAAKVKEYLAGNEWTINSTRGTYFYYKNHMVYYEDGGDLTPGGYVIEPNTAFGYWQMDGDRLTTRFEVGTPEKLQYQESAERDYLGRASAGEQQAYGQQGIYQHRYATADCGYLRKRQ